MMTKLNNVYSDIAVATPAFKDSFADSFNDYISLVGNWNWEVGKAEFDFEAFDKAKLVIFTGGEDINPKLYNQKNKYSYYRDERDYLEEKIFKQALYMNKKMLGVCRGHQLINALLGGNLVQDISRELKMHHQGYHNLDILKEDSIISRYFPDDVNSMHHQGVTKVGRTLTPTTFHNGVYESCESDGIITVQFHPEFMGKYSNDFFRFIKSWANIEVNN